MNFLKYIIALTLIVTSCADQGSSTLNEGAKYAEPINSEEVSETDMAQIPTAVSGGFRLIKCNYDAQNIGEANSDVYCQINDENGNISSINNLNSPEVFISNPPEVRARVFYCDDFNVCHWRVNVEKLDANISMSQLLPQVQFGVKAYDASGKLISLITEARPSSYGTQSYANSDGCNSGICRGEMGESCNTVCGKRFMIYDQNRAWSTHTRENCLQLRKSPHYPQELDNDIWDNNGRDLEPATEQNPFTSILTRGRNELLRQTALGCSLLYNIKWYYYILPTKRPVAGASHPNVIRYCYCK